MPTEVVHGIENLVRDFTVEWVVTRFLKQFDKDVDGVGVLESLMRGREHGQVLDELEHRDLMVRRHLAQVFKYAYDAIRVCNFLKGWRR